LLPDGAQPDRVPTSGALAQASNAIAPVRRGAGMSEPAYSRRQALGTGAFWLLLLYTVLLYPVQAGVSLHQAPFLIERGIDPTLAATIVGTFSLTSALATLACGALPRTLPIRYPLALTGAIVTLGVLLLLGVASAAQGYIAAGVFGFGIGAILTLLPIAWADYFGRAHFGAIRGIALPAQVLAQAVGPVLSGILHDLTGGYVASLQCFAVLAGFSVVAALLAREPRGAAAPTIA
jgi:cyanate permease